jgi:hypothetical protein
LGMAVFEKHRKTEGASASQDKDEDVLRALDRLRKIVTRKHGTLNSVRGAVVFDGNQLYIVKPIGQRFWSQTAALNDADEIAGRILMRSPKEDA